MPPVAEARRTKRERDASEELALEEHIASRRAQLLRERQEAPALRARAADARARATSLTARWQRRMVLDLLDGAASLEREADVRESMSREYEYESTVVKYMRIYHQRLQHTATTETRKTDTIQAYVRQADLTGQQRTVILDEYLMHMHQTSHKVAMSARDECPRCSQKLLLCAAKSIMTCPECGYAVTYLDATSSSTSFDDVIDYSSYSYKRANHMNMHIALVQGKETHRVPDEILLAIARELYQQRVRDPKEITQKKVRDVVRALRLRKAYDHIPQCTARLSGIPPKRISAATEEKLRNMFMQMQPAFEMHAPKSRTNFLSYGYVLYRCFQILGLTHMLDSIVLLKGKDKLELNDAIFRKMCTTLGWPIFDLPP